ncbi:PREDICTED: uncharacterized protein LOC108518625 [Rhinopithecus bieti]|uniref:uncharacterized protein LOC108518625 n=1 Tax=Rhinopithecus bieti TaxID=61621 RepID=UPI00083C64E9|nr:PREDICTED: uncharacterized protein LOC108518625 [Rhinopithecus bieti]
MPGLAPSGILSGQGHRVKTPVWTWAGCLEKLLDTTDSTTDQPGCCCLQTSPALKDSCSHQLWNFLEPNLSPDCLQGPVCFWITSWRRLTGAWDDSWEVSTYSQGAADSRHLWAPLWTGMGDPEVEKNTQAALEGSKGGEERSFCSD